MKKGKALDKLKDIAEFEKNIHLIKSPAGGSPSSYSLLYRSLSAVSNRTTAFMNLVYLFTQKMVDGFPSVS